MRFLLPAMDGPAVGLPVALGPGRGAPAAGS